VEDIKIYKYEIREVEKHLIKYTANIELVK